MATYYVRVDGNDSNTGTGPGTGQAWQTIGKALGATGIGSGDTLYIAPGDYRIVSTITIAGTYSSVTQIIGDTTCSQFTGLTPGRILISTRATSDIGNPAGTFTMFTATSKSFLRWSYLVFEQTSNANIFALTNCTEFRWIGCYFQYHSTNNLINNVDNTTNGLTKNYVFSKCIFTGWGSGAIYFDNTIGKSSPATSNYVYGLTFELCVQIGLSPINISSSGTYTGTTFNIYNCTGVMFAGVNLNTVRIRNCISTQLGGSGTNVDFLIENCSSGNIVQGAGVTVTNCQTGKYFPYNTGVNRIWGISQFDWYTVNGLYTYASGTSTGAPTSDIYGVTWDGITPNQGAYNSYTTTIPGQYNPTERNASTITIAPGSTSQSIELYLGATGLAFNTSGLSAYYIRNRSAPVAITLVTQTATGAWTSGGFAEISSSLTPGVYRLDLPDAALAAGADDVTVVVRGASGTNGAVMTVKLSSGGLTSAQTASAVLDAVGSSYVTAGSIGYAIQNSNVASISGSTAAADELEGALLHNGTDYISAELVTPVTSAALVRMGPYEVKADGLGASDPLDIQKGAQHGVDIQCVDGNGNGIDITSATVTAKVYNSGSSLVDTYSCTATYAADGRATFTIDTTVTNSPGTYTATITRTTGASDTQVFGPLRIYVRDI